MKHTFISVIILLCATHGYSQYSDKIASGRPGQAISAQTTGKHVFQLETGFDHAGANYDWIASRDPSTFIHSRSMLNATLLRFGVLNKLEIHSGWEFREDKWTFDDEELWNSSGMSFSSIGIRHNLFEGDGKKPSLGYQVSAKLNILSDEYNSEKILPHFMITSGISLTDKLGLTLNSGMDFGDYDVHTWIYIVNFGYSLGDNLFTFAEMYGSFLTGVTHSQLFEPKFDAGFGYFLNSEMQLDILGGYALNDDLEEYFVSIGFSWRINHPEEIPAEPAEPAE